LNTILIPGHNPGPMTGAGTNTYLLPGAIPTLIDAATGDPRHLDALARALDETCGGAPLARLLLTHAHPDHAGGVRAVLSRWPSAAVRKMPSPGHDEQYGSTWTALRDGEAIDAGSGRLRAVHTPGHAPDHLCFFDEDDRTLYSGDLIVGAGTVVIPASHGGSLKDYLDSLGRVRALQPARILSGHGPAILEPVDLIDRYVAHRAERERQILDVLSDGPATVARIVDRVYDRLAPPLTAVAGETVTAHLVKLGTEGIVSERGGIWTLGGPS
jgi:glyoxylase-like metal-dependent hydrolase (beta-lactamase superfamily II)